MHKALLDKVLLATPHSLHRGTYPQESNTDVVSVEMAGRKVDTAEPRHAASETQMQS
jgi:hypothetical protein